MDFRRKTSVARPYLLSAMTVDSIPAIARSPGRLHSQRFPGTKANLLFPLL
jgi:hypothetical protein